jgi:hypothetical protein
MSAAGLSWPQWRARRKGARWRSRWRATNSDSKRAATAASCCACPARARQTHPASVVTRKAASVYIPISAEAGKLLYALVRAGRPQTVVEFGTSFGVAALPGPIGVVLLDGWTELCLPVLRMEISSWTGPQVRA